MADSVKPVVPPVVKPGEGKMQAIRDAAKKASEPAKPAARFTLPHGIDSAEVSALYSALRDGDYTGVFKRSVRLLDSLVNEPRVKPLQAKRTLSSEDTTEFTRNVELLASEVERMEDREDTDETVAPTTMTAASDAPSVTIGEVIVIARLVLGFIERFRK